MPGAAAARGARWTAALDALAEINLSLSERIDVAALLRRIAEVVRQLTGARSAILWQAQPVAKVLVRRAWSTDPSLSGVWLPEQRGFGEGATGWIAEHRQPLFAPDVTRDARALPPDGLVEQGYTSLAGVPLVAGDELIGVLTLNLERGRVIDDDERLLLATLASQAAVAITNARLFAEVTRRGDRLRKVADLARSVSSALDLEAVLSQVTEAVVDLRPGILCILRLVDHEGGGYRLAGMGGTDVAGRMSLLRFGEGLTDVVGRTRQPLLVPDMLRDPRTAGRDWFGERGLAVFYGVPIEAGGELLGILAANFPAGAVPTADEREAIDLFAAQAAVAIRNTRLFAESEQRRRAAEALSDVGRTLSRARAPDQVARQVADSVCALVHALGSAVYRVDAGTGDLRMVASSGDLGLIGEGLGVVPRGTMVAGLVARQRRTVSTANLLADPEVVLTAEQRARLERSPHRAVLAVPLVVQDVLMGVLALGDREGRIFTPDEIRLTQAFADQATIALDNASLFDQLERRLRELRETQAQLVQAGKLSAVGQLVSGVAHELNNPLSVVIGYAQLLLRKNPPAEMRGPLEAVMGQGQRMARIVQSLLLFARQGGQEREAVNLAEAMEKVFALRASQLHLSNIQVEHDHAPDLPPVLGDPNQLQQVFLNLLLNAEQVIAQSGVGDRIRLRTATRADAVGRWVVGQVIDDGPGIRPEILPRIFEPFFTTKEVGAGTGLGLSVSYGIVQEHGGRIEVESTPGSTTFSVLLPVARGAAVAAGLALAPAGRRAIGEGRRALVVDDEVPVARLVGALLREERWGVDEASSGQAGLACARAGRYDLVVSDVRMADGSGEDFYRAVVAERPELATRFLFITGDTANPAVLNFLARARVPVLAKPFRAEAFYQAVDAVTTPR
jgi:signal transduction histidine kinase